MRACVRASCAHSIDRSKGYRLSRHAKADTSTVCRHWRTCRRETRGVTPVLWTPLPGSTPASGASGFSCRFAYTAAGTGLLFRFPSADCVVDADCAPRLWRLLGELTLSRNSSLTEVRLRVAGDVTCKDVNGKWLPRIIQVNCYGLVPFRACNV